MAKREFPSPNCMGMHRVGCIDLMHRSLLVRLFYPADISQQTSTKWLPNAVYAQGYVEMMNVLLPSVKIPPVEQLLSPVVRAAYGGPLKPKQSREGYPVAVLSHGLGGNRCMYSATSISLASHGYFVANVEHRDQSASTSLRRIPGPGAREGEFDKYVNAWIPFNTNCGVGRFEKNVALRRKQVKIRRKDISDALDLIYALDNGRSVDNMTLEDYDYSQFASHLNTESCFVIGHSFGGGTVIQTLYEDRRLKCGIALDSNLIPVHDEVYREGFSQPVLFINSELGYQWKENMHNMSRLLKPANERGTSTTPVLTLRGTTHGSYSDPVHCVLGESVDVSHKLVIELTCTFVNRFLKQDFTFSPNLDGGKGHSENILPGLQLSSAL